LIGVHDPLLSVGAVYLGGDVEAAVLQVVADAEILRDSLRLRFQSLSTVVVHSRLLGRGETQCNDRAENGSLELQRLHNRNGRRQALVVYW
jgi:hypothetical protein